MRTNKHDLDDDDDNQIVPDGGVVHVRLNLIDAQNRKAMFDRRNQQHYAETADAARKIRTQARDSYVENLTNAWRPRGQTRQASPVRKQLSVTEAMALKQSDYQQFKAQLQDAWKTKPRDFAQPDLSSRPGDLQRRPDPGETDPDEATEIEARVERERGRDPADIARDVEARRRAAHAEFSQRLSNAWRRDV